MSDCTDPHPRRVPRVLGLLVLFLLAPPCLAVRETVDRIVAVVNDDVITHSELRTRVAAVRRQLRSQGNTMPSPEILDRQVLDRLIQDRLQMQVAARAGIGVDDITLEAAASNIAAENQLSLAEFRRRLEADGHSYHAFLENVRNELTIQNLYRRRIYNRVVISEREIDDFLASQELQESEDPRVRLSHILLSWPQGSPDSVLESRRRQAEAIHRELLAGADFAAVALRESESQTAPEGGDLGWRKMSEVPSLFVGHVPEMAVGDISGIIRSENGLHIIQLTAMETGENVLEDQIHLRHILLRPNQLNDSEAVRQRLSQLRQRILLGDDFATLAKAHSEDPLSAIKGGDLGWNSLVSLTPRFADVVREMPDQEISEPFASEFGWHIAQVLGRRQYDNTESVMRSQARNAIFNRKLEQVQRKWIRSLRDEAYVEYRFEE